MLYDAHGCRDDFEYLSVNPAFACLTGLDDVTGKRVTEVLPSIKEQSPELLDIYGRVAETGEPAEFDIDFAPLHKWLHVSATRPREGEFVAFFYDVTARVAAEQEAREASRRLKPLAHRRPRRHVGVGPRHRRERLVGRAVGAVRP